MSRIRDILIRLLGGFTRKDLERVREESRKETLLEVKERLDKSLKGDVRFINSGYILSGVDA